MAVEGLPHRRGNVGGAFDRLRRRRIVLVDGCDGDRLAYEIRVVVEAPVVAIPGRDDEGNGHLLPVGQLRLALEGGIGLCLDVEAKADTTFECQAKLTNGQKVTIPLIITSWNG